MCMGACVSECVCLRGCAHGNVCLCSGVCTYVRVCVRAHLRNTVYVFVCANVCGWVCACARVRACVLINVTLVL